MEDDVAARLEDLRRKTGESFKDAINETLREGLLARERRDVRTKFRVTPLGPGVDFEFESTSALLEELEEGASR